MVGSCPQSQRRPRSNRCPCCICFAADTPCGVRNRIHRTVAKSCPLIPIVRTHRLAFMAHSRRFRAFERLGSTSRGRRCASRRTKPKLWAALTSAMVHTSSRSSTQWNASIPRCAYAVALAVLASNLRLVMHMAASSLPRDVLTSTRQRKTSTKAASEFQRPPDAICSMSEGPTPCAWRAVPFR